MSDLRAFICADIEGVSGYVDPDEDTDDRAAVRRAMTRDVNATIDGVRDAVAGAEVIVADAHGSKRNVVPAKLDPTADLVRGGPRPLGMVQGGERGADIAFLVGFHDRPGTGGHIEHVFTGSIAEVTVDGNPVGELELNARLLATFDVPVGLVSGDDVLGETVEDEFPDAAYVTTKETVGTGAAVCRHPDAVRADLREAATRAVERRDERAPPKPAPPFEVEVTYVSAKFADVASLWPAVERGADSRTITNEVESFVDAYQFVRGAANVSL